MPRLSSITAFFPAYNDAGTIPTMIIRALQTLPEVADDYEVVVINDGSTDDTGRILDELAGVYPRLRVIHRPQPSGYGGVLRGGFAAARLDWVFYTDRDVDCDFRLMRRAIFDQVTLESTTGTITFELVKKIQDAGFRIVEVPVHHWYRQYGNSQFFNFPRVARTLLALLGWWWRLVIRQEHRRLPDKAPGR